MTKIYFLIIPLKPRFKYRSNTNNVKEVIQII